MQIVLCDGAWLFLVLQAFGGEPSRRNALRSVVGCLPHRPAVAIATNNPNPAHLQPMTVSAGSEFNAMAILDGINLYAAAGLFLQDTSAGHERPSSMSRIVRV
jgi:hypothetical protein